MLPNILGKVASEVVFTGPGEAVTSQEYVGLKWGGKGLCGRSRADFLPLFPPFGPMIFLFISSY